MRTMSSGNGFAIFMYKLQELLNMTEEPLKSSRYLYYKTVRNNRDYFLPGKQVRTSRICFNNIDIEISGGYRESLNGFYFYTLPKTKRRPLTCSSNHFTTYISVNNEMNIHYTMYIFLSDQASTSKRFQFPLGQSIILDSLNDENIGKLSFFQNENLFLPVLRQFFTMNEFQVNGEFMNEQLHRLTVEMAEYVAIMKHILHYLQFMHTVIKPCISSTNGVAPSTEEHNNFTGGRLVLPETATKPFQQVQINASKDNMTQSMEGFVNRIASTLHEYLQANKDGIFSHVRSSLPTATENPISQVQIRTDQEIQEATFLFEFQNTDFCYHLQNISFSTILEFDN